MMLVLLEWAAWVEWAVWEAWAASKSPKPSLSLFVRKGERPQFSAEKASLLRKWGFFYELIGRGGVINVS
ncbi:hypothetical protein AA15669_0842 [Saccharibacter floricola DSM 15669]|uniref:Uncharacterized protein n=1 Tax=Saccharibacter floricola DSM 15669 TaxID=1123227 RepID=A0ABQ0NY15_9PROT|nr:hypothetical protein AA15669_0842 [Saccharibacter floricola DSM 15669]